MSTHNGFITMPDGTRLYFDTVGSGPSTLVILNGFSLLDDFKYLASGRTIVALDLRNRGRSDFITDKEKLQRGIHQDVDDLEIVRQHFGLAIFDLMSHSYAGMPAVLYAAKYPSNVNRLVPLASIPPDFTRKYPAHLTNADAVLSNFFAKIQELEKERGSEDPIVFCRKFWEYLRLIYVANSEDAAKLKWENCKLPTERNAMTYWMTYIQPSIQTVRLSAGDLSHVQAQVLVVHGTKDRSAPYGSAREWAMILPDARLLTVEGVAHAPWIEAPDQVLGPIQTFLDGSWPAQAEKVESI